MRRRGRTVRQHSTKTIRHHCTNFERSTKQIGTLVPYPRLASQKDVLPPATPGEIEAFEAALGKTLPRDYREFLLRWNGADFQNYDNVPYFPIDYEHPGTPLPKDWYQGDADAFVMSGKQAKKLDSLFGIGESELYQLPLRETSYGFNLWVPEDFLAIGVPSDFYCRICLDLRSESYGEVLYWYNPGGTPEEYGLSTGADDLDWLAASFQAFWDSLVELPWDDGEKWS